MANRYFYKFRATDLGLTPTFVFYKNAATLVDITPPANHELAGGVYYFDPTVGDPEIVFQIDGGASLPTDQRYVSSSLVPRESDVLSRMVGLLHENSVMSGISYLSGKLAGATVKLYDSRANANTDDGSTGLLYTYTISADYSGGNLSKYKVLKA